MFVTRTPMKQNTPETKESGNNNNNDNTNTMDDLKEFIASALKMQQEQTQALVDEHKEVAEQLRREIQDLNERTSDAFADIQNQMILERAASTPEKQQEKAETKARRSTSYIGAREAGISHGFLSDHIQQVVQPQVLVTQQKPDPKDLMMEVTLKSVGWMLGRRREFTFNNNQHTKPAQHCSEYAKKKMVDWNRSNGYPLSDLLTYSSIHDLNEADFLRLAGALIRGTQAWSWAGYVQTLGNCVSPLKSNKPGQTTLEIEGYHLNMHTPVNTLLDKIVERRNILRNGATEEEKKVWPKPGYGKSSKADEAGEIRVVHKLLGPFADSFEAFITVEVLKGLKNVDEWVTTVREANDELQKMSQVLVFNQSRLVKQANIEKIIERGEPNARKPMSLLKPPARYVQSSDAPSTTERYRGTPSARTPFANSYGHRDARDGVSRQSALAKADGDEYGHGNDSEDPYFSGRRQPIAPNPRDIVADSADYGDEYNYDEDDSQDFANLAELSGRNAAGGGPAPPGGGYKKLFDHKQKTPVDGSKPCYNNFYKHCPGCGYRHDDEAMMQCAVDQILRIRRSRFVRQDWLEREIKKPIPPLPPDQSSQRGYAPRDPTLRCVIEAPASQSSSRSGTFDPEAGDDDNSQYNTQGASQGSSS